MTTKPSIGKNRRGKLKITKDSVLRIIESYYELKGLKVAMEKLEQLNELFSTEPGWNEASAEIMQYLTEKRKEEQQKQREEKLEELHKNKEKKNWRNCGLQLLISICRTMPLVRVTLRILERLRSSRWM